MYTLFVCIHGVRRPCGPCVVLSRCLFVSLCEFLPVYGVDPAPSRRGRTDSALGARANHGLVAIRSAINPRADGRMTDLWVGGWAGGVVGELLNFRFCTGTTNKRPISLMRMYAVGVAVGCWAPRSSQPIVAASEHDRAIATYCIGIRRRPLGTGRRVT